MEAIILTGIGLLILVILIVPRIVSTDVLRLAPFLSIPSGELKSKHGDKVHHHTAKNTCVKPMMLPYLLTKDTPENALTLARSKQISIPGWKRPIKTKQ